MKTRVIVGLLLAVLFFAMFFLGGYFQLFVISAAMVISIHEMGTVFAARNKSLVLCGAYVFAALQYWIYQSFGLQGQGLLLLACVLLTLGEWYVRRHRPARDLLFSLFFYIYPLLLYGILTIVLTAQDKAAYLLVFAGPLLGDTMAYFIGTLFGKRKLCPRISPKKTVEGSVAGFFGGLLGGLLTWALQPVWNGGAALLPLLAAGFFCGGVGQLGDLFASYIKRWAGVKDYGNLLPGHGGVMDRLDSVLMCAPVILAYMHMAA